MPQTAAGDDNVNGEEGDGGGGGTGVGGTMTPCPVCIKGRKMGGRGEL